MGPAAKNDVGPDATEAELCAHMQAYLDGEIEAFDALYAAFAGRLRGYRTPAMSPWTRAWAQVPYRLIYDPDGRPPAMRRAGRF